MSKENEINGWKYNNQEPNSCEWIRIVNNKLLSITFYLFCNETGSWLYRERDNYGIVGYYLQFKCTDIKEATQIANMKIREMLIKIAGEFGNQ